MPTSLESRFSITAKAIPVMLATVIILSMVVLFVIGELDLLLTGSYVILSFAVALSLAYTRGRICESRTPALGRRGLMVSMTGFFISIAIVIAASQTISYRTIGVFGVLTLAGGAILIQIFWAKNTLRRRRAILSQLVIYHIIIIYSLSLTYWYFVGGTDVVIHIGLIRRLLSDGVMPSTAIYSNYRNFPLWYLFVAISRTITQLTIPLHHLVLLLGGLAFVSVPLLTYAVAQRVGLAPRERLMAAFLIVISIPVVLYGAYFIPRSVVLIHLIAVIYVFFRPYEWRTVAVFAVLTAAIVVYHPSSPPFITVLFGGVYIARVLYLRSDQHTLMRLGPLFGIFLVAVIAYWTFYADMIIEAIANKLLLSPVSTSGFAPRTLTITEQLQQLWEFVPYSILLAVLLYNVMVVLPSDTVTDTQKLLIVIGIGAAALSFPNPLLIVDTFQELNFNRWGIYTPAFVSVGAAIGIAALRRRLGPVGRRGVFLVLIVLIFSSLTAPTIANDNPTFGADSKTPYLTKEETTALRHTADMTSDVVMTDYVSARYLAASQWPKTSHLMPVHRKDKTPLTGTTKHILLLRQDELRDRGLGVYPTQTYGYRPGLGRAARTQIVRVPTTEYHKLYASGETVGYTKQK